MDFEGRITLHIVLVFSLFFRGIFYQKNLKNIVDISVSALYDKVSFEYKYYSEAKNKHLCKITPQENNHYSQVVVFLCRSLHKLKTPTAKGWSF